MDTNNEYGVLQRQKDCLVLLKAFDEFCQQKNIIYSLDSGSLLGAIRHKGFIPWDDDIDIIVDRSTYQKLVDELNASENFCCFTDLWFTRIQFSTEKHHSYKLAATIDVFVLDKAPKTKMSRKLKTFQILLIQSLFKQKPKFSFSFTWLRLWLGYQFGRLCSYEKKLELFNKVSSNCSKSDTKFASCYNYLYKDLHVSYSSDIMRKTHRTKFEDIEVNIIDDYDNFLTELYGDYMTPPPQDQRVPIHV